MAVSDTLEGIKESARLVLMENPRMLFSEFTANLRDAYEPEHLPMDIIVNVFKMYRGWDGRQNPTHSIETGLPLY